MEYTGAITYDNLGSIFFVFLGGLFLAIITLGVENWFYKNQLQARVKSAVVKVSEFDKEKKKGF